MTITLLLEYAVGLALVGFAAWRLATGPGLDDFVWGFALLWFTAMALQYASEARATCSDRPLWTRRVYKVGRYDRIVPARPKKPAPVFSPGRVRLA